MATPAAAPAAASRRVPAAPGSVEARWRVGLPAPKQRAVSDVNVTNTWRTEPPRQTDATTAPRPSPAADSAPSGAHATSGSTSVSAPLGETQAPGASGGTTAGAIVATEKKEDPAGDVGAGAGDDGDEDGVDEVDVDVDFEAVAAGVHPDELDMYDCDLEENEAQVHLAEVWEHPFLMMACNVMSRPIGPFHFIPLCSFLQLLAARKNLAHMHQRS